MEFVNTGAMRMSLHDIKTGSVKRNMIKSRRYLISEIEKIDKILC